MSKNIILLSDGTGNGAAKRNKTNVWRLYDALDLHREDQVAFYDDGVGAQEFLPFKLLGGAFGWGLKKNIRELYKFLCHTYIPGDRIYLFGFSRGAFTVRVLAGMIAYCGVYKDFDDESKLDQATRDNYNAFRSHFKKGMLTQWLRTYFGKTEPVPTEHHPDIAFIGVWDTVDAYGLPIDELATLWDKYIYPMYFPDYTLSNIVQKACHALSVDDERKTFHPLLWDESRETGTERIEQVWFPGVHSDVGGGYPRYSLALVALDWMITKAEAQSTVVGSPGIHLIEQRRVEIMRHSDWHGPQHDSRALAGIYYRYSPRDIEKLCNDKEKDILIENPKLHRSVMERISRNVVAYAPVSLPEEYEVVATSAVERVPEYEAVSEKVQRKSAMQPVFKVIQQRKILYFCMVSTTLVYFFSGLIYKISGGGQYVDGKGMVDSLLRFVVGLLPSFIAPWINMLRDYPVFFYVLLLLFIVFVLLKIKTWDKTQLLVSRAWCALKKKDLRVIDI